MQGSHRWVAVSLLVALAVVVSGVAGPVTAQTQDAGPRDSDGFAQQSTPENATGTAEAANNSTARHVNPDNATDEETISELERVLAERLSGRLNESAARLSEGEYNRAQGELDEEYADLLSKYAEIEAERGNEELASEFERAAIEQRNLTLAAQEFNETLEAYQEAKRRGDEEEARRLAHRLNNISTRANVSEDRVREAYTNLSRETDENFSEARTRVAAVEENLTSTRNEIVAAELRATRLTLTTDDSHASFVDPMRVEGRLTLPNGSAVAEREITVAVGDRRYRTQTDSEGRFQLDYRPTTLSVNASEVTVRYVPDGASVYTASNGTLPISVEQVTATVDVEERTDRAAYGEQVVARGTLSVDGRPVPNYPLSIGTGGQSFVTSQTTGEGSFSANGSLPASVPSGERPLEVESTRSDAAVAVSARGEDFVVESTPTNLTLSVRQNGSSAVATGRLTTEDGQAIEGQPVRLSVGGETVERVETDADGRYEIRVGSGDVGSPTMAAAFDGSGSNLESSRATARLADGSWSNESEANASGGIGGEEAPSGTNRLMNSLFGWLFGSEGGGGGGSEFGDEPRDFTGVGIVAVVLASGWFLVRRLRSRRENETNDVEEETESEDTSETESPTAVFTADELLERGRVEQAIRLAYRSVQTAVTPMLDGSRRRQTHRQFYRACRRSGIAPQDDLDTLIETYEVAVYGEQTDDAGRVHEAVEAAQRLVRQFREDDAE
ncbi:hypothetical protein [Halopelagius longus]|uniref:DUF4129 domain-containing protein n=1 Tax=Halopelagius longus TaxID=1236180 RepID=A0A370IG75_9EURY|nr:hypothetical protein [Halopelagius longus]RDI69683.1 hypothetical protein DWB78_18100 [Halopelagius longus]